MFVLSSGEATVVESIEKIQQSGKLLVEEYSFLFTTPDV